MFFDQQASIKSDLIANSLKNPQKNILLYSVTIFYFLLPCLIFLFGFTRWYVILLAAPSLLLASLYELRSQPKFSISQLLKEQEVKILVVILVLAFCWMLIMGSGFLGVQTSDQYKNHAILKDLIIADWPVIFPNESADKRFLSYSLAYYLVPALAGKMYGWSAAAVVTYIWATLGIGLMWCWLRVFFAKYVWLAIAVFIFFSGLDILGLIALNKGTPIAGEPIEWWSGLAFLQYSSNMTLMCWGTQHTAVQWLLPCIMFYRIICEKKVQGLGLQLSIAALWSHFTLLGVLIFLPLIFRSRKRFFESINISSLLAFPFLLVVFIFYTAKSANTLDYDFIWNLWDMGAMFPIMMWFYLFEFGLVSLIIWWGREFLDKDEHYLFWSVVVFLCCCPLLHVGIYNDMSLRAPTIPLFILFILFISTLTQAYKNNNRTIIAITFIYIFIGSFTPMNELFRQITPVLPETHAIDKFKTNEKWLQGINIQQKNCLITSIPEKFKLKSGDQIYIYGPKNGYFPIEKTWIKNHYQIVCIPKGKIIEYRLNPFAKLKIRFYRDGEQLGKKFKFRFKVNYEDMQSIKSIFFQQYSGSENSLFYKYFLANTEK